MRRLLTASLCITLLASVGCALAGTLTYTGTIPLATTNWNNSISIPQFDPSLGTLTGITFILTGRVEGSAMLENLETVSADVTVDLSAKITLMRPDTSVLVAAIPVVSVTENVAAFDGQMDFQGDSGRKYENLSANRTESSTSVPPSADLALFTGTGSIVLPIRAEGFSSGSGAGNLLLQFSTLAFAEAQVKYDYTAVPEPSGLLALMAGFGGLAGLLVRGRRA